MLLQPKSTTPSSLRFASIWRNTVARSVSSVGTSNVCAPPCSDVYAETAAKGHRLHTGVIKNAL